MDLKTFELFARYNVWSTQKLSHVLKNVSDEDFNAECGLFFKSISGTLNHLLVGELYLWIPRFSSKPSSTLGGVLKSMLTLNEAIIDVKEG